MTVEIHSDIDRRFVVAPAATLERDGFRIVWPEGGHPAAFDVAAAAMLDCFDQPLLPGELADDLVAALGLGRAIAAQTVAGLIASLLGSGHLIPDGANPTLSSTLAYPPSASP